MRTYLACLVALLVGIGGAWAMNYAIVFSRPKAPQRGTFFDRTYYGLVTYQSAGTMRMRTESGYSNTDAPVEVEFRYDDSTRWSAVEFVFSNGIVVEKRIAHGGAINLPEGAAVKIVRDLETEGVLTASDIVLIKRSTL